MSSWRRYWLDPVEGARIQLLLRGTLLLLAFDSWLDLAPHGGRYGIGEFNVAHFSILDALQPTPTPALYVGVLFFLGLASLTLALTTPSRLGLAAIAVAYTYSWTMSMLDSYQHHYLVSWVLLAFAMLPATPGGAQATALPESEKFMDTHAAAGLLLLVGGTETVLALTLGTSPLQAWVGDRSWLWGARGLALVAGAALLFVRAQADEGPATDDAESGTRLSAYSYVFVCFTCAVVYFYTAVTKMGAEWRGGHALRRLGRSEELLALQEQAVGEGLWFFGPMNVEAFWALMAKSTILVQVVACIGFLLAARQETLPRKWRRLVPWLGLAPLSFHIGAERMGLEIGWFSYYMLLITCVVFAPASAVRAVWGGLAQLVATVGRRLPQTPGFGIGLAVVGAGFSGYVGGVIDLPGAQAGMLAGAALILGLVALERGVSWHGLGLTLAAALAWLSAENSDMRFDYYRFVGGDHRRRGDYEEALAAYEQANRYAPEGKDRRQQEEDMRRRVEAGRRSRE